MGLLLFLLLRRVRSRCIFLVLQLLLIILIVLLLFRSSRCHSSFILLLFLLSLLSLLFLLLSLFGLDLRVLDRLLLGLFGSEGFLLGFFQLLDALELSVLVGLLDALLEGLFLKLLALLLLEQLLTRVLPCHLDRQITRQPGDLRPARLPCSGCLRSLLWGGLSTVFIARCRTQVTTIISRQLVDCL